MRALVSHGQTLLRTEGKGLGHGHRAVCRPAPWGAYQSQHSVQSHDSWSMWLTGKFKISVWVERKLEVWEVRWMRSVLSLELEHSKNWNRERRNVASPTLAIAIADVMTGFTWLLKFLGDKLPFPWCGIGSGHARLQEAILITENEGKTFFLCFAQNDHQYTPLSCCLQQHHHCDL